MQQHLTRRDIIKTLFVTSATSLIGQRAWAAKVAGDVTAASFNTIGTARILLSSFPTLNTNGGSVRLGSSNVLTLGPESIFPAGLFAPIIITRISATEYLALDSTCLHAGCVLPALSGGLAGQITCPCHGSKYDSRGKCIGGPAPIGQSLRSFPTTVSNGILRIETDQFFNMAQTTVLNGTEKRLQITWDSFDKVEYELRWRPNFATEPAKVNFATSASGAMATSVITGNDNGASDPGAVKIYIVPQDGIYQVAIRLRTV